MMLKTGFTLVELLVVIAIVAILALVGLTVFSNVLQNTRITASKATFNAIYKQIEQQRVLQGKILANITGSYCTNCSCRNPAPPPTFTVDSVRTAGCTTQLTATYITGLGMKTIPVDGWGDPIMMDENELEGGTCGGKDYMNSINSFSGNSFTIPFYSCPN